MSIFSDMIREMVKEEIAAAVKEQTAPATPDTPPATPDTAGEPMVTPPEPTASEPMVTTPASTPEQFNVEQFRGELRKELSNFMKDTLNGQAVTVETIDPDVALRNILGFTEKEI